MSWLLRGVELPSIAQCNGSDMTLKAKEMPTYCSIDLSNPRLGETINLTIKYKYFNIN
jgi:hypothetical protein